MDRLKIECEILSVNTEIQLDRKSLPDEPGPTFMLSVNGCFNGYLTKQKNGSYRPVGDFNLSEKDVQNISDQIKLISQT